MKTFIKLFLFVIFTLLFSFMINAQTPPHPNGGSGPTGTNTPVGGGASLTGGLLLLSSLAMGYGAKKIYKAKKKEILQ